MPETPTWLLPPPLATSPAWQAQRELAQALRELNELCVLTRADPETLQAALGAVQGASALLRAAPQKSGGAAYADGTYQQEAERYVDQGAMLGHSNPVAGPMRLRREEDKVIGEVTLGPAHGGAPGLVHGGIVATLLDEILGHAAISGGASVVTATLQIRYHAPTPLHVPLRCEGWLVEQSGRRYKLKGHVLHAGKRTASAEGVFVDVSGGRFESVFAQASPRPGGDIPPRPAPRGEG